MSFGSQINTTYILEPLILTADTPTLTACTALYTNQIISCSGDTTIFLSNGVINFDGNIYTNDNISANTVNASTYLSGGTNIYNLFELSGTSITGGTFNNDELTLVKGNGDTININGFTDYYTTGTTLIGNTVYFDRNDLLSAYTLNLDSVNIFVTGVTFNDNLLVLTRNDGQNLNTFINNFTGLTINGLLTSDNFSGNSITANTITANTISATTYYGDGSNLSGISTDNYYTTGTTLVNNIVYFDRNDQLSAYTLDLQSFSADTYVTGFTFSSNTLTIKQNEDKPEISATIETVPLSGVFSSVTFNINTTGSISATTYYGDGSNLSGITDYYVTGGTISGGTLTLERANGDVTITGFTSSDTFVTGFTYNDNNLTLSRNQSQPNLIVNISTMTGLTINGITNLNGQINSDNLSGSTDRMLEVDSGGTFSATKEIISAYITSGSTVANLLEDVNNWDINGNYTGSTITGTFMGQKFYNNNYFFECVSDNIFIRLIRG